MQHIDTERLAALADEPATAEEATHLSHCLACRRERDVYLALLELARREGSAGVEPGALAPVGEPLTAWDGIAAGLRTDGLIDDTLTTGAWRRPVAHRGQASAPGRRAPGRSTATWWRQAAAASVLLAAGLSAGRATAGVPVLPWSDRAPQTATGGVGSDPAADPLLDGAGPAASTGGPAATAFADVSEAADALARAQRDYQRASAYLAVHDTAAFIGGSDALRARLAALDELIPRVRAALSDAPEDPVLNQYYQNTYDARETTLRQLDRALPVGVRLTGY